MMRVLVNNWQDLNDLDFPIHSDHKRIHVDPNSNVTENLKNKTTYITKFELQECFNELADKNARICVANMFTLRDSRQRKKI